MSRLRFLETRRTQAREFYGVVLGLKETAKPAALANRGGLWFVLGDGIGLHLGV